MCVGGAEPSLRIAVVDRDEEIPSLNVRYFTSAEALIGERKYMESCHILYLDSELGSGKMDGIECARQIRKKNRKAKVFFFSVTPDMALASYEVKAENYILKICLTKQLFLKQLDSLVKREMRERSRFLCKYNRRVDILDIGDIMYVERLERKDQIGTRKKKRYCSGSLAQIRQALGGRYFVELNRSVSVNVNHIRRSREDCVEMRDGKSFSG